MRRNKKGQGLSINTLVIIALAVFVIFLLIGFITSGFGFFTSKLSVLKGEELDTARTKCLTVCSSWQAQGSPQLENGVGFETSLCDERRDHDITNDGVIDSSDGYTCKGALGGLPLGHASILSNSECPAVCDFPSEYPET